MKNCPSCKTRKPKTSFYKSRQTKDGLYGLCKECAKKASSAWRKKTGWKPTKEWQNKWRLSYRVDKQRLKAHRVVAGAIRNGTLKAKICKRCGAKNTDAHHNDYSKPLKVVWLCRLHHRQTHSKLKAILTK